MPLVLFMGKCCNSLTSNVLFGAAENDHSSVKIKFIGVI
jgi:hypothetical protein